MADLTKHGPGRHTSAGSSINCLELPFPGDPIICIQTISLLPLFRVHSNIFQPILCKWFFKNKGRLLVSVYPFKSISGLSFRARRCWGYWWLWSTNINLKCRAWLTLTSGTRSKENPHQSWQRHRWVSVYLNVKRGFTWCHYVFMTQPEFSYGKLRQKAKAKEQQPLLKQEFITATTSALCHEHGVNFLDTSSMKTNRFDFHTTGHLGCASLLQTQTLTPSEHHHHHSHNRSSCSFHSHDSHDHNKTKKNSYRAAKWMPSDNCCTPSNLDEKHSPPRAPRSLPLAYHKQHTSVRWRDSRIHLKVPRLDPIWRMVVSNKGTITIPSPNSDRLNNGCSRHPKP